MPIDHYVLSGFASRLVNADIHSFDGMLYILQEYEVRFFGSESECSR